MDYDIFISYSRKDIETADHICEAFDEAEISYFIDRQDIGGGMEFPETIAEAIQNSKLMLFLASKNSYVSKFINSEVTFAFNKKPSGTIIPYIIDGSKLPSKFEFIFSTVNILSIQEHPIEPTLIDDISLLLDNLHPSDDDYDDGYNDEDNDNEDNDYNVENNNDNDNEDVDNDNVIVWTINNEDKGSKKKWLLIISIALIVVFYILYTLYLMY